jgi:hypothetical protein
MGENEKKRKFPCMHVPLEREVKFELNVVLGLMWVGRVRVYLIRAKSGWPSPWDARAGV